MGALTDELREFLDAHPVGVLATTSRATDGHVNRSCTSPATASDC